MDFAGGAALQAVSEDPFAARPVFEYLFLTNLFNNCKLINIMASLKNYSGLLFVVFTEHLTECITGELLSYQRYCEDLYVGLRFGLLLVALTDLALLVLVGLSSSGRQSRNSSVRGSVPWG